MKAMGYKRSLTTVLTVAIMRIGKSVGWCVSMLNRVIEKDGRDLKLLYLKKYWTDLHVWRLKMFR